MIYIRGYVMLTEFYLTKRERNVCDGHLRFQSACWRRAGTRAYRAIIDIRGYVMLSEFLLDQEIAESFVMGMCDCSLQAGEVLDQESTVQ